MIVRALRRVGARLAAAVGLGNVMYRLLGWLRRVRHPGVYFENRLIRARGAPDGLPLPPDRLVHLVSGAPALRAFLEGGRGATASIRDILATNDRPLDSFDAVLDFGCGCGRVIRHWREVEGPGFYGCDYNPALVEWARDNLPFAKYRVNGLRPPLPYDPGTFDLVYALSVFTHLTEPLQQAWLEELRRVLKPDGLLLVTVHGHRFAHLLTGAEQRRFNDGQMVITHSEYAGTNVCAAFHPPKYVRENFARGFDLVDHQPQGALGNGRQDQYLFRRA